MPEGTAAPAVAGALRKKRFNVYVKDAFDKSYLYATKGGLSRMGPFLSHVGLLALFVGGLVTAFSGQSTMVWGAPGDTLSVPFADYRVVVNAFTIQTTDKGEVKDYISDLTVLDPAGREAFRKRIEVNAPLEYRGVSFYQSSYQLHPRRVRSAVVTVSAGDAPADTLTLPFGKAVDLPGTPYRLRLVDFAADFQMTSQGIVSRSRDLHNPAFLVVLYEGDHEVGHQWLFARFPDMHAGQLPVKLGLVDFEPLYYTGLQASINPGSPFIWAGFLIMTVGLMLVFYLNHQRVWVCVVRQNGKSDEVFLAGSSHKFKADFGEQMREIVSLAKAAKDRLSRLPDGTVSMGEKRKEQSCSR
jgi:cytochrome c biogenesis protein